MNVKVFKFPRYLSVLFLVVVCYLSFSSSLVKIIELPCIGKAQHILAYLILTFFGCMGFTSESWIVPSLLFSFGVMVEFVQEVIGREFSLGDIAANGLGVLLGVVIYVLMCHFAIRFRERY